LLCGREGSLAAASGADCGVEYFGSDYADAASGVAGIALLHGRLY
jgi:hypothetical protein